MLTSGAAYRARAIAVAMVVVALGAMPAAAEKRVALVVGNGAYIAVGALANPANDARLVASTLHALGFTLVGEGAQVDLDRRAFERAIQAFGGEISPGDVALFFYAGHGLQVAGVNYLLPVDAAVASENDVASQLIGANAVLREMDRAHGRLNIIILDACRDNPFEGIGMGSNASGLARMKAPENTLISFATQPGNVALDGSDGDSPFSKALATTMRRGGLELFDMFNEVGHVVLRETKGRQQPWISTSPIAGSFYFSGAARPRRAHKGK